MTADEMVADIKVLFQAISSDSEMPDPVVAILCAAYADKYLGLTLAEHFTGADDKLKRKLLKPEGLLGPFGSKLDVARAIEAIGPVNYNDLKLVAIIRNKFAHDLHIQSFDHPKIVEELSKLQYGKYTLEQLPASTPKIMREPLEKYFSGSSNRLKFVLCASMACMAMSEKFDPVVYPERYGEGRG